MPIKKAEPFFGATEEPDPKGRRGKKNKNKNPVNAGTDVDDLEAFRRDFGSAKTTPKEETVESEESEEIIEEPVLRLDIFRNKSKRIASGIFLFFQIGIIAYGVILYFFVYMPINNFEISGAPYMPEFIVNYQSFAPNIMYCAFACAG